MQAWPLLNSQVVAVGQEGAVPTISTAISRSNAGRWLAFIVLLTGDGDLLPSVDFLIVNVSLPSRSASKLGQRETP